MEHSQSNFGLDQCHDCGVRRKQVANPTTNYGFVLPSPTDLVTDLPADFDVALQGVDTRLKALQPGTTLGDLAYSSATANTNTRLGIGTTGQVLTVAGGVPSWATPGASPVSFSLLNAGGTALTGAATITVSGISAMQTLMIYVYRASTTTASDRIRVRFNGDTATNYAQAGFQLDVSANTGFDNYFVDSYIELGRMGDTDTGQIRGGLTITGCNSTGVKAYTLAAGATGATTNQSNVSQGVYKGTSTISSVSIISSSGNFDAGTIYIYGSAS